MKQFSLNLHKSKGKNDRKYIFLDKLKNDTFQMYPHHKSMTNLTVDGQEHPNRILQLHPMRFFFFFRINLDFMQFPDL